MKAGDREISVCTLVDSNNRFQRHLDVEGVEGRRRDSWDSLSDSVILKITNVKSHEMVISAIVNSKAINTTLTSCSFYKGECSSAGSRWSGRRGEGNGCSTAPDHLC